MLLSIEVSIAIAVLLAVVAAVVSAGLPRLPERRRGVRRRADQPRPDLRPGRGRVPAHRLRHDRRGVDGRRPSPRSSRSCRRPTTTGSHIAFVSIGLITVANLRGLRESGNIFAVPTYLFLGLALSIVAIGGYQMLTGHDRPGPAAPGRGAPRDGGRRRPAPAQGLRRRLRRPDRRRGHRQRRARRSSRPRRRTPPTRCRSWPCCSASCSSA